MYLLSMSFIAGLICVGAALDLMEGGAREPVVRI